ncbi:putative stage IV sporulation protein YqfD [Clostridium acetireducens DSM 10703]|uniref:Putative stage IV sporulation protein YqfD n=1 Tax=Clostridium acetireducens DSM 10703 TaxID=1121290 RepID=A0A1E8F1F9_9CLOT|nr:sporulation protein YqfD [Clostridium acetireducens]OFI07182.1 putative stage IV sporulation protein YqfD [Clostridium acetireducens DSM 10703]
MSLKKFKKGIVIIEAQSLIPERFINLLWKNNVHIKNLVKKSITTIVFSAKLKDYDKIDKIAKSIGVKIKILKRRGLSFLIIKAKRRVALVLGLIVFISIIYYLSTFIWVIDISSERTISPYEIRQQLMSYGIKPGVRKKQINVYNIEEDLIRNNDSIMWVRARIEGAKLKIKAAERQSPPEIISQDTPCDLIAKRDAEVIRIYTTAGTSVVKPGDIIKKGQVLVKGEEGKEEMSYLVHAKGNVIGRTFYEEIKEVNNKAVKRQKTGKKLENIYIKFKNKKFYIKKNKNKFDKYDRIENNKYCIGKDIYYEVKETYYNKDINKLVEKTSNELYDKITSNFDKSVKVVDKIVDYKPCKNDYYNVRILVVAEENIAMPSKIE